MRPDAAVIIPAAGSGSRMRAAIPKQFLNLGGKPLLIHTVSAFYRCDFVSQIVLAVSPDYLKSTRELFNHHLSDPSKLRIVAGGTRRQDSVQGGLACLDGDYDVVLVHDGARPLISGDLIKRCYSAVIEHGAAIAAVPVKDTLKKADSRGRVAATLDRTGLWQAQTPQGASKSLLLRAFRLNQDKDVTDEASLLENAGIPVHLVVGEERNIKVTRKEDLMLADSIVASAKPAVRVGHGFDAHRFADSRRLVLGGVEVAHDRGLAGHSDADVVCHALCDALLGAIGGGDIGRHFPDNDEQYRDISSLILLDNVVQQCLSVGMQLANADITIVCQAPKLTPYIKQMQYCLAECCQAAVAQINIKATTTEKMGYIGRQEGIGCHAVVLLQRD
jgi:2-C-methyl-D-erythritol 4-phosphate cytidylyltransferase/2-C-methyl-D-erythritol 2,4-cyclodiphosphate synthase